MLISKQIKYYMSKLKQIETIWIELNLSQNGRSSTVLLVRKLAGETSGDRTWAWNIPVGRDGHMRPI